MSTPPPPSDVAPDHIAAVRRFSRFYTRRIGVLQDRLLDSPLSLGEGRIVYELAQRPGGTAADLRRDLGLDAGYLSRVLATLAERGLLSKTPSAQDGRQTELTLTAAGHAAFAELDDRSKAQIAALLAPLSADDRARLTSALATVEQLLDPPPSAPARLVALRPHRPGDIGWVIGLHARIYTREYGWDETFEGFVAEIAGAFLKAHDPARECCRIAEVDGERAGSVFVVRGGEDVAKLRMMAVDPAFRGLGLGRRLVEEAIGFARTAGYRRMVLWTNDVLVEARRLYASAGFVPTGSEPHHSFGVDLVGETWERTL